MLGACLFLPVLSLSTAGLASVCTEPDSVSRPQGGSALGTDGNTTLPPGPYYHRGPCTGGPLRDKKEKHRAALWLGAVEVKAGAVLGVPKEEEASWTGGLSQVTQGRRENSRQVTQIEARPDGKNNPVRGTAGIHHQIPADLRRWGWEKDRWTTSVIVDDQVPDFSK